MEQTFRPFITEKTKRKPLVHKYEGYEVEKKFVIATKEEDHSKNKNSKETYDLVLHQGTVIEQGYIKDISLALDMLRELRIYLAEEFKPNTIRLRKYGLKRILTLKDKKETKTREVEFLLSKQEFLKWWKFTEGARVYKKRLEKTIKGFTMEIDAFTDRYLLLAECEVSDEKLLVKVPKMGMDVTGNSSWANKNLSK